MDVPASRILEENSPGERPRRAQVYVGFRCGQGCGFCYYRGRCGEPMLEPSFVTRQIDFLSEYGIRDFEFTGGEPSECRNLRGYCEYAKSRSPAGKVAVITNGGLFASDAWPAVDEVLLSYHLGRDASGADMSFFPKGCTYGKASKTAEKAHGLGKLLRVNVVVGTFNVRALDSVLDDVVGFGPAIVNFLPVNLFDGAKGMASQIDYSVAGPALVRALDRLDAELPSALKFVRYVPFCALPGREKHAVGMFQHIFDWFDWNVELNGLRSLDLASDPQALGRLGAFGSTSFQEAGRYRSESYEKCAACLKCRYLYVCDGVEKTPDHSLLKYVRPCPGKISKNANEYVGGATRRLYEERYGTV